MFSMKPHAFVKKILKKIFILYINLYVSINDLQDTFALKTIQINLDLVKFVSKQI